MGPFLVPFKEKSQLEDISLITKVNDEIRQDDRTSRMLFNIPKQINYISTFTTLMPGDIIITGTPTGAGANATDNTGSGGGGGGSSANGGSGSSGIVVIKLTG